MNNESASKFPPDRLVSFSAFPTPPLLTIIPIPRPLLAQQICEAASRVEKGSDQESHHAAADFVFEALDQITVQHIFSDQPSRADDRGDPVVQLAPPLMIGQEEFDYIEQVLREVLTEAWTRI